MAIADRRGAAQVLFEAIAHEDSAVRYWAAVAAAQMGARGKPAAKALRNALRDEAPEVRAQAAFALANLGSSAEALPVLRDLLSHPNRGVRLQAAHVLDALGAASGGSGRCAQAGSRRRLRLRPARCPPCSLDSRRKAVPLPTMRLSRAIPLQTGTSFPLVAAALLLPAAGVVGAAKPPNILWLSIEDTGQQVRPYDAYARTPNIARLAREGVTFLNAFSHSPVCAPTRSGIVTGMYPTAIGTHHMRSDMVPPPFVKAFPEYLRRLGYYTTNNSKTDYNFPAPITAWDESGRSAHWKNRPDKNQPFFAVFNYGSSHEGSVRRQFAARRADPANRIHDAAKLALPPYYPDTPKVREAWAAYYDVVTQTDRTIGEMLQELKDAGIAEETLVVFWGDHGVGLARGKRWLYDSGVRVPLIARWPGKIEPGAVRADFVQFLDLAPTMIAAAGGEPPGHMHGRVILGDNQGPEPQYLYHARDRMDERYDMIRAVRNKRYLYLRNFESHKPWVQFMRTPSQGPIYQELGRLKREGGPRPADGHIHGRYEAVRRALRHGRRSPSSPQSRRRRPLCRSARRVAQRTDRLDETHRRPGTAPRTRALPRDVSRRGTGNRPPAGG